MMKKTKIFLLIVLSGIITSCVAPSISKIPDPELKSTIKVEISTITNISPNYVLELSHLTNLIGKTIDSFDFSEYLDENNLKTSTNKLEIDTSNLEINIDRIIRSTLEKRLKKFIKQLRTYNPYPEEIIILNTSKIEEELLKQKLPLQKITNYTTNITFETNYYISKTDTNKVEIEIIQKENIISEVKIQQKDFTSYIHEKYPWVLDLTNGIRFSEGQPADFSIYTFYKIDDKKIKLEITVIVSNKLKSNFTMMKTNMDIVEFLSSDEKMFNQLKHFIYNYQSGLLVLETDSDEYDIFIDDVYLGRGKKLSEILCRGIHKITFSKDTYKLNEFILIQKDKINFYRKNLKDKKEEFTKLYIDSIPSGADIFIENEYFGKTPTNITLPRGKHRVWINKGDLETFRLIELTKEQTNIILPLQNLKDTTSYNVLSGVTILFGAATISSIFLYFWADSQERHYDFLYQKERKPEYYQMREYYYYFKDNMRTVSITGAITTFVLWGITLGIESDKFSIQLSTKF